MKTAFNQCKYVRATPMTKITNITLDGAKPLPKFENEAMLFCFLDMTDTSTKNFVQTFQNFQI